MPLHDAVGVNCSKGATTDIKAQVPSVWANGWMLANYACITRLDITLWREKVMILL